jgi:hypothetical protein
MAQGRFAREARWLSTLAERAERYAETGTS